MRSSCPAVSGVAVDAHVVSDSLLTQILDGIVRCRVFLADVSAIGTLAGKPIRDANVLYEVGLAHATRLFVRHVAF